MPHSLRDLLLIGMLASTVFLTQLGSSRLWDRDEPRNAGCAAEMLQRGDWVVPTFNGELRAHKPVLTYWAMMLAYSVLGVSEFAARLPSAVCGVGTVLLTCLIGCRLYSRQAGCWAAVALATTVMFSIESRAATHDGVFIFCTTLATAIFVVGTFGKSPQLFPSWPVAAAMYACMGLAVLAKGPVGQVLPTAVIGMYLLIKRLPETDFGTGRWWKPFWDIARSFQPRHFLSTCWLMRPCTALAMGLLVALPWYLQVHFRTDGAWTHGFFFEHNLDRATSAMEGHDGGPLYYPLMLIVGFFPWSIFWMPVLWNAGAGTSRTDHGREGYLLAACWLGVYVALFSVAQTKLPHYIVPCYPGLALLTGAFLARWSSGDLVLSPLWPRLAFGSLATVGIGMLVVVPILSQHLVPGEALLGLLGLPLLLAGMAGLLLSQRGRIGAALPLTGLAAATFLVLLSGFAASRIDRYRELTTLTQHLRTDPDTVNVLSLGRMEPSWVFYAGRPIEEHYSPIKAARSWTASREAGRAVRLVTTSTHVEKVRNMLPHADYTTHHLPGFLGSEGLVVLSAAALPQLSGAASDTPPLR